MPAKGKLYLIPTSLGGDDMDKIAIPFVREVINNIDHYIVEKEKHARRYLRKLDIRKSIDQLELLPLNKHTDSHDIGTYLNQAEDGKNIGLISEAGCPGVADPGAEIVALAHSKGIKVVPIAGPSSILMSLMASGFNGQSFCFHGYLPKDQKERIKSLKEYAQSAMRKGVTQIFMDTPFRNNHVMEDILNNCDSKSELCVAVDITLDAEMIQSMTVGQWKKKKINLHKRPCMFLFGRSIVR